MVTKNKDSTMTVLVTGGAGYLGAHLVTRLIAAGHDVRVFDRFLFGEDALSPVASDDRLTLVHGDIRRLQEHDTLFDDVNTVIHLAGITDEETCARYEAMAEDVNVSATVELARVAASRGVERFLYPSMTESMGVLGQQTRRIEANLDELRTPSFDTQCLRLPPLFGWSPRMRFDIPLSASSAHVQEAATYLVNLQDASSTADETGVVTPDLTGGPSLDDAAREIDETVARLSIDRKAPIYSNARVMEAVMAKPVEDGGEPLSPTFLPLARPVLGDDEAAAILEAFHSGWITSGPQIAAFEKAFGDTVGAHHTVATISCTAALHLSFVAAGVTAGDEVITTPITWPSTGNTLLNMGVRPVFVDVEADTLNIDASLIEAAITDRTRAIMPVHMAGQPCDLAAIKAIANRHSIPLIEDAAHALGAEYGGVPIGSTGEFACFSFYAIKNITTMEGGAVTLRDGETADRIRFLASNGMSATAWERYGRSAAPGPPEVIEPGYKYMMGNVSAAMGLVQLKRWPEFRATRRDLAAVYLRELADIEELQPLTLREGRTHSWHLFIVRLDLAQLGVTRDEFAQALRRENIGSGVHFLGLHLHRYYRETLGLKEEHWPVATAASQDIISLPLYPGMTQEDVVTVTRAIRKVVAHLLAQRDHGH